MEIERKFLLGQLPKPEILGHGEPISQGYISADDPEIRVRSRSGRFYLTIKSGRGLSRKEFEVEIPLDVFQRLWSITHGRRIDKTRFTVRHKGLAWEIDEYHGNLSGLYIAEVELASEEQHYDPPDFLEIIAEVTQDDLYKNRTLATKGLPPEPYKMGQPQIQSGNPGRTTRREA